MRFAIFLFFYFFFANCRTQTSPVPLPNPASAAACLSWLSAGKAAETKVKTSGRMATPGAALPSSERPPRRSASHLLAAHSSLFGAAGTAPRPPCGSPCAHTSPWCASRPFPFHKSPSEPPSVLSNMLRAPKKKIPLFPKKTSHFPISPRCTQLPIPAPLPAAGRTWPGIFWRRTRLCFEHRATWSSPWVQSQQRRQLSEPSPGVSKKLPKVSATQNRQPRLFAPPPGRCSPVTATHRRRRRNNEGY